MAIYITPIVIHNISLQQIEDKDKRARKIKNTHKSIYKYKRANNNNNNP